MNFTDDRKRFSKPGTIVLIRQVRKGKEMGLSCLLGNCQMWQTHWSTGYQGFLFLPWCYTLPPRLYLLFSLLLDARSNSLQIPYSSQVQTTSGCIFSDPRVSQSTSLNIYILPLKPTKIKQKQIPWPTGGLRAPKLPCFWKRKLSYQRLHASLSSSPVA